MPPQLSDVIQDLLYAEEFDLLRNPTGGAIKQAIRWGVAGPFEHQTLKQEVNRHHIEQAFAGQFPLPQLHHGDLVLGRDVKGNDIRIPTSYLNQHTYVQAASGGGKTTLARSILLQCSQTVPGIFAFDFRKREYGILAPYFKRIGKTLFVPDILDLQINPLEIPPGTPPNVYAPNISEVLARILKLPPGANKVLHPIILYLYTQFGITSSGTHAHFPTLFDLYIAISKNKSIHPQTKRALLDSLTPILLSLRKVLACRRGHPIEELMRLFIAFECMGISEIDKDLIVNVLVLQALMLLLNQGVSNPDKLILLILCDEAARIVGRDDSSISDIIQVARGCGIGLILLSQSAQMSSSINSNTPNKMIGLCSSYQDLQILGSSIGVSASQKNWLLQRLTPGTFCMSIGQGNWRHPFLCRVPHLRFPHQHLDAAPLPYMKTVPAPEFARWEPEWAQQILSVAPESQRPLHEQPASAVLPAGQQAPNLTVDERRFLQAVIDEPELPMSIYPKRIHMAPRKAAALRKALKNQGLLTEELSQQRLRGRPASLLKPTKLAIEVMKP